MESFEKKGRFSGRIWRNWGNTAWADMAGFGSIGLSCPRYRSSHCLSVSACTLSDRQCIRL